MRPAAGFVKLVSDQESPVPANAGSGDFLFFISVFNPLLLDRIHFYAGSSHRIRIPKVFPFSIRYLINRAPAFKAEPLSVRQVSGKRSRQYADLYNYLRFCPDSISENVTGWFRMGLRAYGAGCLSVS